MINLVARMEEVVQSSVSDGQFMGSVLVDQHGKILLDKGYGYANLEWQIPNSPTTKFRLGSVTKQFTAAAILLLEDSGKLKITELVKKYMPEAPAAWDDITIFNLLTHTSGIPNYTRFPEFAAITTFTKTPEQQLELFRNKPLVFQPGTQYEYNNSGYMLLGYLIEKISGQSYQEFVVKNIFKPLGMNDSGYDSHAAIIPHRASGYEKKPNGITHAEYLDMSLPYSAGSLYATTHDLLRWQEGLFGGKLLSSESLTKMITPFKNNYGFGVVIQSVDGSKSIMHAGGINGFNAILLYFPEDKLTIVSLSNMNAIGYVAQDIAMKMVRLAHGHTVTLPYERKHVTISPDILKKYLGTYQVKSEGIAYTKISYDLIIAIDDDNLMAQSPTLPQTQLFLESESKFFGKIPDVQIEFFTNDQGKVSHLVLTQDGESLMGLLKESHDRRLIP